MFDKSWQMLIVLAKLYQDVHNPRLREPEHQKQMKRAMVLGLSLLTQGNTLNLPVAMYSGNVPLFQQALVDEDGCPMLHKANRHETRTSGLKITRETQHLLGETRQQCTQTMDLLYDLRQERVKVVAKVTCTGLPKTTDLVYNQGIEQGLCHLTGLQRIDRLEARPVKPLLSGQIRPTTPTSTGSPSSLTSPGSPLSPADPGSSPSSTSPRPPLSSTSPGSSSDLLYECIEDSKHTPRR